MSQERVLFKLQVYDEVSSKRLSFGAEKGPQLARVDETSCTKYIFQCFIKSSTPVSQMYLSPLWQQNINYILCIIIHSSIFGCAEWIKCDKMMIFLNRKISCH